MRDQHHEDLADEVTAAEGQLIVLAEAEPIAIGDTDDRRNLLQKLVDALLD